MTEPMDAEILPESQFAKSLAEAIWVHWQDAKPEQRLRSDELTRHDARLRAALKEAKKNLRDASRGAEINAHINQSLTGQLATMRARLGRAIEALRDMKNMANGRWCEWGGRAESVSEILEAALLAEHEANDKSTKGARAPEVGGAAETGASAGSEAWGDAGLNHPEQVRVLAPEPPPLVEPTQDTEWWCSTCCRVVDSREVTHDERHDERDGGCGGSVGTTPATKECLRCGADEWRQDGYCSCECQDLHEVEQERDALRAERDELIAALREARHCGSRLIDEVLARIDAAEKERGGK